MSEVGVGETVQLQVDSVVQVIQCRQHLGCDEIGEESHGICVGPVESRPEHQVVYGVGCGENQIRGREGQAHDGHSLTVLSHSTTLRVHLNAVRTYFITSGRAEKLPDDGAVEYDQSDGRYVGIERGVDPAIYLIFVIVEEGRATRTHHGGEVFSITECTVAPEHVPVDSHHPCDDHSHSHPGPLHTADILSLGGEVDYQGSLRGHGHHKPGR